MELEKKALTDEEAEQVIGGNDGLIHIAINNHAMDESQQPGMTGLVRLDGGNGKNSIYAPLRLTDQISHAGSEKLITSHQLPIQAGGGGSKETSPNGKRYEFQMPSDGVYLGGVTFELTKID